MRSLEAHTSNTAGCAEGSATGGRLWRRLVSLAAGLALHGAAAVGHAWASSMPLPGLAYMVMTRRTGMIYSFRDTLDSDGFALLARWCTGQAHAIVPQGGSRRQQ
jgi:hypothetical protein